MKLLIYFFLIFLLDFFFDFNFLEGLVWISCSGSRFLLCNQFSIVKFKMLKIKTLKSSYSNKPQDDP